jgi:hypothetical protein
LNENEGFVPPTPDTSARSSLRLPCLYTLPRGLISGIQHFLFLQVIALFKLTPLFHRQRNRVCILYFGVTLSEVRYEVNTVTMFTMFLWNKIWTANNSRFLSIIYIYIYKKNISVENFTFYSRTFSPYGCSVEYFKITTLDVDIMTS